MIGITVNIALSTCSMCSCTVFLVQFNNSNWFQIYRITYSYSSRPFFFADNRLLFVFLTFRAGTYSYTSVTLTVNSTDNCGLPSFRKETSWLTVKFLGTEAQQICIYSLTLSYQPPSYTPAHSFSSHITT